MTFSIPSKLPAKMANLQQNGNYIPASRHNPLGRSDWFNRNTFNCMINDYDNL